MSMEIILKPLLDNVWGLKPTKEQLVYSLLENTKYSKEELETLLSDCYDNDFLSIDLLTKRVSITQNGLDFVNNKPSSEITTQINTHSNLSQGVKFLKELGNIIIAIVCSLIAAIIWEKYGAVITDYFKFS